MKIWQRSLIIITVMILVIFGRVDPSLAKRASGRIGGGAFKSAPSRSYSGGSSSSYAKSLYRSGLSGSNIRVNWDLETVLFVIAALLLYALIRWIIDYINEQRQANQSNVSLLKIQVGLLASARSLQQELSKMALTADTESANGLIEVLHETALALQRHPEYWVYVNSANEQIKLQSAESRFSGLALTERSKLSEESLSNVRGRLLADGQAPKLVEQSPDAPLVFAEISEYIIVTLLIAATNTALREIAALRSTEQLQMALQAIGLVNAQQLLAMEVLWEPQSEDYTLTNDDVISIYPDLIKI